MNAATSFPTSRMSMSVIGAGQLALSISRTLTLEYGLSAESVVHEDALPADCALILSVDEEWNPQRHTQLNTFCLQQNIPWLRLSLEPGEAIVGPLVLPGVSGCSACVELRRRAAQEQLEAYTMLRERFTTGRDRLQAPWLAAPSISMLSSLIAEEVTTLMRHPEQTRTRNAFFRLSLATLRTSLHRCLPDPHCPACGQLPDDDAATAQITLRPQPKPAPHTYRVRSLAAQKERLLELYVDPEAGLIRGLNRDPSNLYANVSGFIRLAPRMNEEIGFGRTLDYELSQLAAVAEAIERYGGWYPGGKRTTVHASYAQISDHALDPVRLGLHSAEQYGLRGYPYRPYTPEHVCSWVWGYSFSQQRPILVPERIAYYGIPVASDEDRPVVCESSNGCALGGCLEEAILYGMLEVAERDAFLLTWYARLAAPRIDLHSVSQPMIRLLIERLEQETGYTVHAFNITVEQGIPCCWLMAVDEQNRPDFPKVLCAAGSHMQPEQALANALHELAPLVWHVPTRYRDDRAHALECYADSNAVQRMSDHSLLYCVPEAFERLRFLYDTPRRQSFTEAFAAWNQRPPRLDLRDDLVDLIARYQANGMDVIVVDQTTSQHRAADFHCVKVLIPGTLPMTFGHHARRITGLERLQRVPVQLGYAAQPLTAADINPDPHPFP